MTSSSASSTHLGLAAWWLVGMSLLLVTCLPIVRGETVVDGRRSIVLQGDAAQVVIDILGGSIVKFERADLPLNPLVWSKDGPAAEARAMAHFLCLDRWGAPSEAEARNGMPFHGEATRVAWKVLEEPSSRQGFVTAEMSASLPMAGLEVRRVIALASDKALFKVTEEVTNRNPLGRLYNIVQHPTVGPPFLDETVLVDANARQGFMQSSPLPNPEEPSVYWPQALKGSESVDLRRLHGDPEPNVVSYTIDEELGWVTASNASQGLLIGYLWKVREYPWLNIWRHTQDGKPLARGLEFGTTGLHQPFSVLVRKGRIFERPIHEHLDAGETIAKSYLAFLFRVPSDYRGVSRLTVSDGRLTLHERDAAAERNLTMEVADLW